MVNIKKLTLGLITALIVAGSLFGVSATSHAATTPSGGGGQAAAASACPKAPKFPAFPKPCTGEYVCASGDKACLSNNPIMQWTLYFINLLSLLVLVGATAMMVFAGIEYMSAADNPQRVQSAKKKIFGVILGLIAYFFMFAFLQWLVPGGIFT